MLRRFSVMVLANVVNLILFYVSPIERKRPYFKLRLFQKTQNSFLEQSIGNNAMFTHV